MTLKNTGDDGMTESHHRCNCVLRTYVQMYRISKIDIEYQTIYNEYPKTAIALKTHPLCLHQYVSKT